MIDEVASFAIKHFPHEGTLYLMILLSVALVGLWSSTRLKNNLRGDSTKAFVAGLKDVFFSAGREYLNATGTVDGSFDKRRMRDYARRYAYLAQAIPNLGQVEKNRRA